MNSRLLVYVLTALWVGSCLSSAGAQTPGLANLKPVGKYVPVVGAIIAGKEVAEDTLTKRKETVVQAFLGTARSGGRLVAMTSDGEIVVEGGDESLFGNYRFTARVPCKFRYEVCLDEVKGEDLSFDTERNILTVRMPRVELVDPVPDREGMKVEESIPTFRRSESVNRTRDAVLAEKLKNTAREKGTEGLSVAIDAGKARLQDCWGVPAKLVGVQVIVK